MEIDWILVLPLLVVVVLAVLVTGPGMWSDKWGWWLLRRGQQVPSEGADRTAAQRR